MADKIAATYHGAGVCKRGCCWTPDLGCARGWTCEHHRDAAIKEARRDREEQHIRNMQRAAELAARAPRRLS